MDSKLIVIGEENNCLNYNLNKENIDVKKIVIPYKNLQEYFESQNIQKLLSSLKEIPKKYYYDLINEAKSNLIFEENIKSELYQDIINKVPELSENMVEIKLDNYNFMNSISNTKFTISLKTENFSINKYYEEKGQIIHSIKSLIKEYLEFKGNIHRLPRIENFQIEIYESFEVTKKIYLKKENNSLLLTSAFGFPFEKPITYSKGGEFYFSIGEDFQFFKNKQDTANIREHNSIIQREIKDMSKVLTNEELILVNNKTKNLNDCTIEMSILPKGNIKIENILQNENSIYAKSKEGFIVHKSTNNFDKISTYKTSDSFDEESSNPKFVLIKNSNDLTQLFDKIDEIEKLNGIIFNLNFYNPILDYLGDSLNLDIIYYQKNVDKSLELSIDFENVEIETKDENTNQSNPFQKILENENKPRESQLEKLKNIDLSTPTNQQNPNQIDSNIEDLAKGLISSPQSSTGQNRPSSMFQSSSSKPGEKKSAIAFLAEAALNPQRNEKPKEEPKPVQTQEQTIQQPQTQNNQFQQQNLNNNQQNNLTSNQNPLDFNQFEQNTPKEQEEIKEIITKETNFQELAKEEIQSTTQTTPNNQNLDVIELNKETDYLADIKEAISNSENTQTNQIQKVETQISESSLSRYEDTLITNILTTPHISNSDGNFIDNSQINQINHENIFLMVTSSEDIKNSNINHILPISTYKQSIKDKCSFLINSTNEYFLVENKEANYFVNLSFIDESIKEKFVQKMSSELNKFSVILFKQDLELIKENINKIENIFIKDINTNEEFNELRNKVLKFEKEYIMKKLK